MFDLYVLGCLAGVVGAVLGGALVFWQPSVGIDLRAVLADVRRCLTLGDDTLARLRTDVFSRRHELGLGLLQLEF
jgi:hypothetical protein